MVIYIKIEEGKINEENARAGGRSTASEERSPEEVESNVIAVTPPA